MNTLENILIIAGISLDVFASMEIQGAMLQKVNKKTLLVVSTIVSLLQLMFFFGGYAAGYGIDRAGVWRNANLGTNLAVFNADKIQIVRIEQVELNSKQKLITGSEKTIKEFPYEFIK